MFVPGLLNIPVILPLDTQTLPLASQIFSEFEFFDVVGLVYILAFDVDTNTKQHFLQTSQIPFRWIDVNSKELSHKPFNLPHLPQQLLLSLLPQCLDFDEGILLYKPVTSSMWQDITDLVEDYRRAYKAYAHTSSFSYVNLEKIRRDGGFSENYP